MPTKDKKLRAEKNRRYYEKHKPSREQWASRQKAYRSSLPASLKSAAMKKEIIALDGEGGGTDDLCRQNYQLLCAASSDGWRDDLYRDGERLTTTECFEFILSLPPGKTYIGYYFGYDVTQILRDIDGVTLQKIFDKNRPYKSNYIYWNEYGIDYKPSQYFRVCRLDLHPKRKPIKGTARTIDEVGTFFQKPFVEVLRDRGIGDKKIVDMIAATKDRRGEFGTISDRERKYCHAECELLAMLMEDYRLSCSDVGTVPRLWRGPGHIAARLHELHKTPKRNDRKRPATVDRAARSAYYGGRTEVTTIGRAEGPIYCHDINSAFAAQLPKLPCPIHSKWRKFRAEPIDRNGLYLADIQFTHPEDQHLCGFPVRLSGRLLWPRMGCGEYWQPEIDAALQAGASVTEWLGGYQLVPHCDCRPFDWVADLYKRRVAMGRDRRGHPLKLGLSSLYGKFVQRVGGAPYQDYVIGGLITAYTRAALIDAYRDNPRDVLMIATDAIYSRAPLPVHLGDGLGQWRVETRDDLFIVQPGVYWSRSSEALPRTRGVPRSAIIGHRGEFEALWRSYIAAGAPSVPGPPELRIFVDAFIGSRFAAAQGKPELSGAWYRDLRRLPQYHDAGDRRVGFGWSHKRDPIGHVIDRECVVTRPRAGRELLRSEPYDPDALTDLQQQILETEAAPDYTYWGNSIE